MLTCLINMYCSLKKWGWSNVKICTGCTKAKGPKDYYTDKKQKDGLNRYCTSCCKVNRALEAIRKRDKRNGIMHRQVDRARRLGIRVDSSFDLADVFKKAFGMCHICDKWVPPGKASPDHILPLSKGGEHIFENVGLTHLVCNLRKGNRI